MKRFQKILVGVNLCDGSGVVSDGLSATCRTAVDKALWLASHTSAEVTFISSILPCLEPAPDAWKLAELQNYQSFIDSIHENAACQMANLIAEAEAAGIHAKEIRAAGKPWIELLKEAATNNYDLLIVGSHKQHAVGRVLLGNTGRRLIRKCPCPVWVTSPIEDGQIRKLLVPTDFSETATESLQIAGSLARQLNAELHVLHALEYHFEPMMRDLIVSIDDVEEFRSSMRSDAERQLNDVVSTCGIGDTVPLAHRHIAVGPPSVMIREAVEELSVDLVVMSTLGRSGIKGMLVGNTAEQVVSHLTCSILAIKPQGFQCPIEFPESCDSQDLATA